MNKRFFLVPTGLHRNFLLQEKLVFNEALIAALFVATASPFREGVAIMLRYYVSP